MVTLKDILSDWDNVKTHSFSEEENVAIIVELWTAIKKEAFIATDQERINLVEYANNVLSDKVFMFLWKVVTISWNENKDWKPYVSFLKTFTPGIQSRLMKIVLR